jgi:tRNA-specific 2-thiouridylase
MAEMAPEGSRPGPIVDEQGRHLGRHRGVVGFTIGQRRGLGVATGEPRYVTHIDAATATVTIGSRRSLAVGSVVLEQVTSVSGRPLAGECLAQYRAHGEAVPVRVVDGQAAFARPQTAVAPGQTIAFYRGDEVVGGAVIRAAVPA